MQTKPKVYNKNLIFLKSTVISLFLVLVTLMIAFVMIKNKKQKTVSDSAIACKESNVISLDNEIAKIETQGSIITILTKVDKSGNQEIIRLGAACGNEINRINFKIKND